LGPTFGPLGWLGYSVTSLFAQNFLFTKKIGGLGYWDVLWGPSGGSVIRSLPINVWEHPSHSTVVCSSAPQAEGRGFEPRRECLFYEGICLKKASRERETRRKEESKEWDKTENQWGVGYWDVLSGPLGGARLLRYCSVIWGGHNICESNIFDKIFKIYNSIGIFQPRHLYFQTSVHVRAQYCSRSGLNLKLMRLETYTQLRLDCVEILEYWNIGTAVGIFGGLHRQQC